MIDDLKQGKIKYVYRYQYILFFVLRYFFLVSYLRTFRDIFACIGEHLYKPVKISAEDPLQSLYNSKILFCFIFKASRRSVNKKIIALKRHING